MASSSDARVVLVTGASGGIGQAIVQEFMAQGDIVVACCRDVGKLSGRGICIAMQYDVRDTDAAWEVFKGIKKDFGRLDVAINNAGILGDATLYGLSDEKLDEVLDVNASSLIKHMRMEIRLMLGKRSGSIVNVASVVGLDGNAGQVAYAASKGAVIAATKSAAKEYASSGIRINAVAPGLIDTPMLQSVNKGFVEKLLERTPMGRVAKPEEVAKVIAFLASNDASYVTGQTWRIDGGLTL